MNLLRTDCGLTTVRQVFVDQVKYRGAWLPWSDETTDEEDEPAWRSLVEWIVENCPDYKQRLVLMPTSDKPGGHTKAYRALTEKYVSYESHHGPVAGPVVCAWPGETHLGSAVSSTPDGQALIALEWPTLPLLGWATAVEAFNRRTGTTTPPLDAELHSAFKSMLMWTTELGGGALKGPGRERPQRHLRILKDAGLDEDFVVTYALALGLGGWRTKRFREHYRAA